MNELLLRTIAFVASVMILAGALALWNFSTQRFVGTNTILLFVVYGWCLFLLYRIIRPKANVSRGTYVVILVTVLIHVGLLLILTLSGEHRSGPMPEWNWGRCEDDCYSFR